MFLFMRNYITFLKNLHIRQETDDAVTGRRAVTGNTIPNVTRLSESPAVNHLLWCFIICFLFNIDFYS